MYFDELALSDEVLDALWDMHFDECTPVHMMLFPVLKQVRERLLHIFYRFLLTSLLITMILIN